MVQNASVFSRSLLKCQDRFMVQAGKDIQQLTLAAGSSLSYSAVNTRNTTDEKVTIFERF